MSSHDYHEKLPGFSPEQVLVDGCAECEWRGEKSSRAINYLDPENFKRAWERAALWVAEGLPNISDAEIRLLTTLAAVQPHTALREQVSS